MHSEMRVFGNLAKLAWQQLVVATAVIQACLVGALAVGLGAPAVEGLTKWTQASEASTRGMATDIAGGGADGGGGEGAAPYLAPPPGRRHARARLWGWSEGRQVPAPPPREGRKLRHPWPP